MVSRYGSRMRSSLRTREAAAKMQNQLENLVNVRGRGLPTWPTAESLSNTKSFGARDATAAERTGSVDSPQAFQAGIRFLEGTPPNPCK